VGQAAGTKAGGNVKLDSGVRNTLKKIYLRTVNVKMVLESEAACPKCLNESGFTVMMSKDGKSVFHCKRGHKFTEDERGFLKPIAN